jgi:copper transport protein
MLVATAAPAWAHAVLVTTDPPMNGVAPKSPPQLTLDFSENVEVSFGAIRVYTCSGARVTTGAPHHGPKSDATVLVSIPNLSPGVYLVAWRVISADSHPVQGTYSLRIGPGGPPSVNACATETAAKSSHAVGVLFAAARTAVFAGLALLIGGGAFLVLIARGTSAARWTRRMMWIGWIVLTLASVGALMLQGPYAAGAGIGDAVRWRVVHDVLRTRYGHVTEVRLLLLAAAAVLLLFVGRVDRARRPPVGWTVPAALVAIGLAGTPGFAGHAGTGDWTFYAVVLDTIHVLAMSLWLGGLVVLLLAALGGGFSGGLRHALITFSQIAFTCVVVLIATGLFASWRQVGFRISGYTSTSYGRILLVKIGLVALLVGLAAISRSIVGGRRPAPSAAPDTAIAAIDNRTVLGLRRSVGGEVALGLAVLIVTALLVNAQPARSALTPGLFAGSVNAGSGQSAMTIQVTIDPARVGVNEVHVYTLTPKGADLPVRDISAKFVSTDGATTVPANLVRGGPNHYLSSNATFTTAGRYQMLVQVLQLIDGNLVDTAGVLNVPIT